MACAQRAAVVTAVFIAAWFRWACRRIRPSKWGPTRSVARTGSAHPAAGLSVRGVRGGRVLVGFVDEGGRPVLSPAKVALFFTLNGILRDPVFGSRSASGQSLSRSAAGAIGSKYPMRPSVLLSGNRIC